MRKSAMAAWAGLAYTAAGPALAEVIASGPGGFVIEIEMPVAAPPKEVYSKLFDIGRWWSGAHTYTGNASNLTLKNEPGGCFCEALKGGGLSGGFVRHATVEYSNEAKEVRLQGALGPLQKMGAHGLLSFDFRAPAAAASVSSTRLVVRYTVSGFAPDKGFEPLAGPVNGVLTEQLTRLKKFVETGTP